ncbi:MAG TPA: hypothetical protein PKD55_23095 [Bellilinea sp.]|nr:hypothetical protein [Bellilinea sp.]
MIRYYKSSLISLFIKLQEFHNDPNHSSFRCLEIQEELISKISYIESQIKKRKGLVKKLKKQLGTKREVKLSKEESKSIKNKITQMQRQIDEYQEITYIFREIGDGIAFTLIDKWDIKPFIFKETAGFISGKKGCRVS